MFIKLLLFSAFFSLSALAKDCEHTKDSLKCVQYIRNYDGDTATFNIPKLHPLFGKEISVRVSGIDTPEIRTQNKCEKKQAQNAKLLVKGILSNASRIDLINIKRGKYFRIVADILVDQKNIKEMILNKRLAYRYNGKQKKENIDWCNFRQLASDEQKDKGDDE